MSGLVERMHAGLRKLPHICKLPLIKELYELDLITALEASIADHILNDEDHITLNNVLLICHLSKAAFKGNLCIKVVSNTLYPSVEELWDITSIDHPHDYKNRICKEILSASTQLPKEICTPITTSEESISTPLCKYKEAIYFWVRVIFWF